MVKNKAWVISVDMGYGHQRAAYPLKDIAYERIITANSDKTVTEKEMRKWRRFQFFYEGISRWRSFPVFGEILWRIYDHLQSISPFYPVRDLSSPSFGSLYLYRLLKKGFIKSLIEYTEEKKKIPFVSTFFATAVAAAYYNVKDTYCVVTDSDINRIWVPERPKKDKLYYLTPTERSKKRLISYGVPEKNIFFTGFPLPKENLGKNLEILKKDLGQRLANLDPNKIFINRYREILRKQLGKHYKTKSNRPLTITYAIGGAGAQVKTGESIIRSFSEKIKKGKIRVNIVAGNRIEIRQHFEKFLEKEGLDKYVDRGVHILCEIQKKDHFMKFNELLHTTDILWTKPSELSFYTALGLPIIISKPLGAHELQNQKWLVQMGTGIPQENPEYADEWLIEWVNKGQIAEAAWEGFLEAPKYGTYNIEKVIFSKNKKNLKFKY